MQSHCDRAQRLGKTEIAAQVVSLKPCAEVAVVISRQIKFDVSAQETPSEDAIGCDRDTQGATGVQKLSLETSFEKRVDAAASRSFSRSSPFFWPASRTGVLSWSWRSRYRHDRRRRSQAGEIIMRYCLGLLEALPMLKQQIEGVTRESIALKNRIVVEIHTASFSTPAATA